LTYYVSPSEEELFLKYNPELQKRSLENRQGRQEDFDHFVGKLKEYSKSDMPSMVPARRGTICADSMTVWYAAAEDENRMREGKIAEQAKLMEDMRARKEEIRKSGQSLVPGGSL
jgi:hypothetical protein